MVSAHGDNKRSPAKRWGISVCYDYVSRCALDAIALDAGGANVHTLRFPVHQGANTLDVGVETAVRAHVRVRDRLAELRSLSTDIAYRGHGVLLISSKSLNRHLD